MAIRYIDRITKKEEIEKVYGRFFIEFLYGSNLIFRFFAYFLVRLICQIPFFSRLYGQIQKSSYSKKKIKPFIEEYHVDATEFLEPIESFGSFNDFFIRKLKASVRPMNEDLDTAVLPADARYLAFSNIHNSEGYLIKGKKFSIEKLIGDATVAHKYHFGSMVFARLCPVDYHRFHFPCNCTPSKPRLINGALFSVNPLALKKNIDIVTENKRMITELYTKNFGTVLYIEVGATYVGSIHQTYTPEQHYAKGEEKGYFEFGGSMLILIFPPFSIELDQDLLAATQRGIEVRGLLGQSLGRALPPI
ncbi:MAG TPA: archaetidylserine decarboxylase [Rhabdochlamydiaceae bacterium]|nr:archaetidylserine decarboxylase [Rhabdochlamydiaceae bacterium]